MATIEIKREHKLGLEQARSEATNLLDSLADELQIRYEWVDDQVRLERQGATGTVDVTDESILIKIDLDNSLAFFKGAVEGRIASRIDAILSAHSGDAA